jgi:RNA polymerase sigma-54 factor
MLDMTMAPEMGTRITPALLNLATLLAMPSLELHQAVQLELAENPALEELETQEAPCERCGGPVVEGFCLRCALDSVGNEAPANDRDGDAIDPLLFVAAPQDLRELLLRDLQASVPAHDYPIAFELVGNLDERGFLAIEPEEIATRIDVAEERVRSVLQLLRELGPPGIAARDTRECMLHQIDALEKRGVHCPYARVIVADYLDELAARHTAQIARHLKIRPEQVEDVRAFVRRHLWPYPALAAAHEAAPLQRVRYRSADLAINETEAGHSVEVLHSPRRLLRLNPLYQDLARRASSLSESECAHVQEYVARARIFLASLRQRESTLQRIGEAIVMHQAEFLRHGVRHLKPLTRAEIAAELGLHESTISRATAEKTALLPNRSLLPISEFFIAARGVQDVLRELIAREPTPLSDEELARQLAACGYPIARRTVAKYRDVLRIPPSHLR